VTTRIIYESETGKAGTQLWNIITLYSNEATTRRNLVKGIIRDLTTKKFKKFTSSPSVFHLIFGGRFAAVAVVWAVKGTIL
jgi:hypothetical protein